MSKPFNIYRKIILICVIAMFLFIWGNSLMPGDISSMQSDWVEQLLRPVLDYIHSGRIQAVLARAADLLPPRVQVLAYRAVDWLARNILTRDASFLVRKAAHFSEYMLLGFLLGLLFARTDYRPRILLPEGVCIAAALVDEGIQHFSAGRAPQLRDVCIDSVGAAAGLVVSLVLLAVLRLIFRLRSRPRGGGAHLPPD